MKTIKKRKYELLLGILSLLMLSMLFKSSNVESNSIPEPEPIVLTRLDSIIINYANTFENNFDSLKLVGGALAIVKDSTVVIEKTFGVKNLGTIDSVNRNTKFRLASVSKGFAGVLTAILDEKGELNLNDKIVQFLPEFKLKDSVNTADLQIIHTLNHTSGLVPHAYDNLVEDHQSMAQIIPRLAEVDISAVPGILYGYQNVMFSLIDTVCRIKLQKTYAQLLNEYIFSPLNMQTASTSYAELVENDNYAKPHSFSRKGPVRLKERKTYYNLLPAAGVNASIADMEQWLLALLGNNPEVVDSSVLHLICNPQIQTPLQRRYTARWGKVDEKYYSLGWRIYDYMGHRIIYHGGYVRGYRAEIAFCPEQKIGIVYLQNSPRGISAK